MAELAKLRSKRNNIKQKLIRFRNYFDSINRDATDDSVISQLQIRLEKITPVLEEFNELQFEIELSTCVDSSEIVSDYKVIEEFETYYYSLVGDVQALCNQYNKKNCSNEGSVMSANTNTHASIAPAKNYSLVKLPPIKLPVFDGQYSNWLEFKDSFVSLVDSDDSLSDIQKFYYLRSSLEKNVLEIIKSLEVSGNNYKEAWKFLTERFENKKLIIYNHIRAIFDHPDVMNESYTELRGLYDSVSKHLRCLKNLGEKTDTWDRLIIYIMSNKFDSVTRRDWETYKYAQDLPTMTDLNNFLRSKCEVLEKLEISETRREGNINRRGVRGKQHAHSNSFPVSNANSVDKKYKCYYCKQDHGIFKCESFLKLRVSDRIAAIKQLKLCLNCFRDSHPSWKCPRPKCFKCKKAHNSLLHMDIFDNSNKNLNSTSATTVCANVEKRSETTSHRVDGVDDEIANAQISLNSQLMQPGVAGSSFLEKSSEISQVLLSTALIKISNGANSLIVRALLDSGSQSNFISKNVCDKLNLNQSKINFAIKGIGQMLTNINSQVNINLSSCTNDFNINVNCFVLPRITEKLPVITFNKNILSIPSNLCLADPDFNRSKEIDILLGSHVFWSIIKAGQVRLGHNLPILQETELGYVIAGNLNLNSVSKNDSINCHAVANSLSTIDENLVRFWEIEEFNDNKNIVMSESQKYCEYYFEKTTTRDDSGRFTVGIPFKNNVNKLGNSRDMALNRFHLLEKRLNKNIELKNDYSAFMSEYLALGHMTEINDNNNDGFFLPHHAVIKNDSLTTKCRVVFDASAKSSSGLSLNDVQFVGPTLQQDLLQILLRFRIYKYVLIGDISKMYRQIRINNNDTKYQKIFWRENSEEKLKLYKLNTVTYGCASSPYLAVKCLLQLGKDNENNHPLASKIIKRDFYMDDLLTGANTESELLKIQHEIVSILSTAGFELRKFLCNDRNILEKFDVNKNLEANILNLGENEHNKTLGVYWDASNDFIKYKVIKNNNMANERVTKRNILSLICQIFDPLGLISPIVIIAKLLMQEMWRLKLSWDEEIPSHLLENWKEFYNNLSYITEYNIPRQAVFSEFIIIELHGFSDASVKAYGACIYIRCVTSSGNYYSSLLCAKSRVAPLKQISLPRLELCGALLLANLTKKVSDSVDIKFNNYYFWTDSTITLYWIKNDPSKWKLFVANRVSEIRSLTDYNNWNHVKSEENPADLISRGVSAKKLLESDLWWFGPKWFNVHQSQWSFLKISIECSEIPEQKIICCLTIKSSTELSELLNKYSSFDKILRVLAYVLRFISNLKLRGQDSNKRNLGALIPEEIDSSLNLLIKDVQIECFQEEYNNILNKKDIPKRSKILGLNPFLHGGILRVGGRLKNSNQTFNKKHPIILPQSHTLTYHILNREHERLLHCGVQNLLYSIRENYWPISGRNSCKKIIRNCKKCFRANPRSPTYLMGDLPEIRVNPASVFSNVGTDFGGPFLLKDRQTRNPKLIKTYICLFVCMCTKAVHIELVSALTTDAFLAAFNRFISRRGRPTNVFSDNGSNYIGANNELNKIFEFLKNNAEYISNKLINEKIKWHFIPARSPNFGGIWEAGIKSAKYHIKRVIGERALTFEEFGTILTQIECILNSRPICPITDDPEDISALTPGHFLVGRPLTSLPEYNLLEVQENRLSKWQKLQATIQQYWARWQREYLTELQIRTKWKQNSQDVLNVGSLVLIRNDNAPTLCWQLGRVTKLYPGKDNIVRVVDIKVRDGVLTRAVNRICVLPNE